jgi:hypothetical protein
MVGVADAIGFVGWMQIICLWLHPVCRALAAVIVLCSFSKPLYLRRYGCNNPMAWLLHSFGIADAGGS